METIKEEKKADLEQLLNSLIEKGWKPFGRKKTLHITIYDCDLNVYLDWWFMNEDKKSFRELVSKESWLWQFVCENGMIKKNDDVRIKNYWWDNECDNNYCYDDSEFRMLESALKDESELEDFLLQNIKIEWEEQRHS